jgi:Family of unknown function (DUF6428)
MKTNEFVSRLRAAPQNRLLFVDVDGHTIHAGYHLTELKAAAFDTVDCGRELNQWNETIVQLWVPENADDDYMTTAKFLKIFDKVRGMIPLKLDAEIRVEYGDDNFFPSIYHVRSVTHGQGTTRVLLQPPATTCKARDRRMCCNSGSIAETCCAAE